MDLNETKIFVAVASAGSLTAAARALGIPLSTISRKITALEKRLGVRLLERNARRLALTDAGRMYHERSARVLGELERAEADVRELRAVPRGTLRVTAPPEFALQYVEPAIVAYMAAHADMRVEVELDDQRADLVRDKFDVAIRVGPLEDSALVARRIARGARCLVASPAYLAAHGTPRHPRELEQHVCLVHHAGTWRLRDARSVRITGRLVANSFALLAAAARSGAGIALIPARMCADDIATGKLMRLLDAYVDDGDIGIYAVYPSSAQPPAKLTAFLDVLARVIET